jgi:hypothetical protein
MPELAATVVSLLTAFGGGGVLGAYFQARFQQRTKVRGLEHDLKQKRYSAILILMLTKLNPEVRLEKVHVIRPDLTTLTDIDNELSTELLNAVVFASQQVLEALAGFIRTPSKSTFVSTALAIRKDLWGKRAVIIPDLVELVLASPGQYNLRGSEATLEVRRNPQNQGKPTN